MTYSAENRVCNPTLRPRMRLWTNRRLRITQGLRQSVREQRRRPAHTQSAFCKRLRGNSRTYCRGCGVRTAVKQVSTCVRPESPVACARPVIRYLGGCAQVAQVRARHLFLCGVRIRGPGRAVSVGNSMPELAECPAVRSCVARRSGIALYTLRPPRGLFRYSLGNCAVSGTVLGRRLPDSLCVSGSAAQRGGERFSIAPSRVPRLAGTCGCDPPRRSTPRGRSSGR